MRDDPEGLLRTLVLTWWARIGATDLGGVIKLMVAESGNFPTWPPISTARWCSAAVPCCAMPSNWGSSAACSARWT